MEDRIAKKIEVLTLPVGTELQWWLVERKRRKGKPLHYIVVGYQDDTVGDKAGFDLFYTTDFRLANRLWKGLEKLVEHLSIEK